MQLSILIATNRTGLLACSRIAQACSWATPDIEVIIRDNSGDAEKRAFLDHCRREHCNIVIAEPCDALINFTEILRVAKGDFVFLLADDDFCFDHAIPSVTNLIQQIGKDPAVAGVTGAYVLETTRGSSILNYDNIESDDATQRVAAYLQFRGPNILHYAPVRREIVERIFAFISAMPSFFSFHDQIVCLLYLLSGKFVRLKRLLYLYDIGVWQSAETAKKRDIVFYLEAGFDPAIYALHWFICGFEGAVLVRNAQLFPDYPLAQRQAIADRWFSVMFIRFKEQTHEKLESRFNGDVAKLREKLLQSSGRLSFQDLLKELCDFMALFSKDKSQSYFEFWDAVINHRLPIALRAND